MEKCSSCQSELFGEFCSNCGQAQKLKRINGKYILSEIGSILNFEKGILFTIRELVFRPGLNIRKYILEDRNRLVKPIVFLIVCSLIYSLCMQFFHFEDGYIDHSFEKESATTSMLKWVSENYGYANILMAFFIAVWIKVFFKKYGYNFFEIIILLCYVMGIGMLLFTIFGIIASFTTIKVMNIASIIGIIYLSWAIGQFFDQKKYINYLKAFFSYSLGFLTFTAGVFLVGFLIDLLQ